MNDATRAATVESPEDYRLIGLEPGTPEHAAAVKALAEYDETIGGIPDCFDVGVDLDPEEGMSHHDVAWIARQHLDMAGSWWSAAYRLAETLAGTSGSILTFRNAEYERIVAGELSAALNARNLTLAAWAQASLGTAGPNPHVGSDGFVSIGALTLPLTGRALANVNS